MTNEHKNPMSRKPSVFNYSIFVLILFSAISFYFNYYLGLFELILTGIVILLNVFFARIQNRRVLSYVESMFINADSAAASSIIDLPIPMVILDDDGKITWYNHEFNNIFGKGVLFDIPISSLAEGIDIRSYIEKGEKSIVLPIAINNHFYRVIGSIAGVRSSDQTKHLSILYWYDETEFVKLKNKYTDEKIIECIICVDNYDELMLNTSDSKKPQLLAEIDKHVAEFCRTYDGVMKKYERDKYMILFENRHISDMKDKKFDILEKVKAIDAGNKISASLSIGIGINGDSIGQNDKFARTAIDMALGRGGDQAVIKDGNKYIFYGGKSNAYEKSTRVKARVVASALKQLILNSDSVFIMGHKNADVDSLGAALGLSRAVKNSGKPVYIILETYGYTVKNMLKRLEKSDEYNGLFITPVQASAKVTHKSLVIVVDTHKPSMVECRDALKNADQIVVIDHHRRSTEFIDNASLVYHEPYASSSSELVSEILQYIDEKSNLTKLEAEALYAGINVDTKNFTFKTGVRTFDAASFLKKVGVDTISVKKLFQNNMEMIINRAEIVRLAEIYRDKIAISEVSDPIDNIETIVAQAADDMLEIEGITASFVIAQTGTNDVIISARSLGDINVQVVMEKLDGGGHLTMAGAQIKNINISSAAIKLKNAIDEYLNEVA